MAQKIKRRSFIRTNAGFILGMGAFSTGCGTLFRKKRGMVVIQKGSSKTPIVVADDAGEATLQAARELADYIEKISGAGPEVLRGPGSVPETAVWVGPNRQLAEAWPDLDLDFGHPEEILIACNGQHLVIAGRDKMFRGVQVEFGTANSVYTFLQDHLDVRWLWPGPLGEDLVHRETIVIPEMEYRYHPQFRQREVFRGFSNPDSRAWGRFQRNNLGSWRIPAGGHAFTDWWERFHEKHPDWFALQPDGTRSGYPRPKYVKLCQSNPGVWSQWLKDAEGKLQEDPSLTGLVANPNDSHSSGVCVCEDCRAWDHPDGHPWTYYYEGGHREEYVAMTDRYITFWNKLAGMLKERYRGHDVYLRAGAYGPSTPVPVEAKIADNIVLAYVGKFPLFSESIPASTHPVGGRQEQKAQMKEWAGHAPLLMYRPNLWYWGGGVWGFPEVALQKTKEDMRFLAENNCRGLTVDTAREHWATQGPMYYLMVQLAWDPYQDADALLEDYYQRGFGEAAPAIKEYWELMDEKNHELVQSENFPMGLLTTRLVELLAEVYTGDFFEKAEELLDRADDLAAGGPEIHGQRVAFFRTGLEYTRKMIQNIELMKKVRESKGEDSESAEQAAAVWAGIEELCRQSHPFAINFGLMREGVRWREKVKTHLGTPSTQSGIKEERDDLH